MWKFIIILLLFCASPVSATFHDFNNGTFGPYGNAGLWVTQSTGGVGNSPAVKLPVTSSGTAGKAMLLNINSYGSSSWWVEFDVKITGVPVGGSKFIKFFGDSLDSRNNITVGLTPDMSVPKSDRVSYYVDSSCFNLWDYGTSGQGGNCTPATYEKIGSDIDLTGNVWRRYKVWVKRATPGQKDGAIKVWLNGVLNTHITNMDSFSVGIGDPTPGFYKIEIGGYVREYRDYNGYGFLNGTTAPWDLWIDNLYMGTTEQGTIADPGICGPAHGETFETLTSSSPNLCYSTPPATDFTTGATTYNWNCPGANGGTTAPCLAYIAEDPVVNEDGVCGSVDGTYSTTEPAIEQKCLKGTLSNEVTEDDAWLWMCDGVGTGADEPCVTYKTVVTGDSGIIRASGSFTVQ
jgi:hypothetical protein